MFSLRTCLLLVAFLSLSCLSSADKTEFTLYSTANVSSTARCLDGSPQAFYYTDAPTSSKNQDKWVVYIQGGGWCFGFEDCLTRSTQKLGTSTTLASTIFGYGDGLISQDCTVNPTFCDWNQVVIPYCDGTSFSGTAGGVTQGENTVYFNGKDNLDAIFTMLTSGVVGKKLTDATEVMLTGCSAGGLSVFIHSDTVQTYLSSQTKYGAIPMSGFFTDEVNIKEIHVYGTEIQRIFDLSQAEQGVHAGCVADNSENPWKCMMAPYVSDYIETPTFILNSIYDSWQTSCELFSAIPSIDSAGNGNCTAYPSYSTCQADLENCTGSQIAQVNTYGSNCLATLKASNLYSKNGNGGFLYSCHTHCAAQQSSPYTTFVNQATGTSMQQAVTKWWSSELASAPLWYEPCLFSDTTPYECNPSCVPDSY